MKVFMLGWEFPPFISGGLGTACYGLTKALVGQGVDITFVLPTLAGRPAGSHVRLLGADNVDVGFEEEEIDRYLEGVDFVKIDSFISPYLSPVQYKTLHDTLKMKPRESVLKLLSELTGNYGPDLMSEVARYGAVAGLI